MTKNHASWLVIAALLCGAAPALAQTTPATPQHVPLQKTIGQAKPEIVPSLIVVNARGASLQGGKLTLNGVATSSIAAAVGAAAVGAAAASGYPYCGYYPYPPCY